MNRRLAAAGAVLVVVAVAVAVPLAIDGTPQVEVVADSDNPLRGEVRVRLQQPGAVAVTVEDDTGAGFRVVAGDQPAGDVTVPLLGLRPETTYEVTVEADGVSRRAGALETGALDADFPPIQIEEASGADTLTLFDAVYTQNDPEEARDLGYVVVVDGSGTVVWYEGMEQPIQDLRQTERGTFLFIIDEVGAREITTTGETVGEWGGTTGLDAVPNDRFGRAKLSDAAVRVDTDQFHHEIVELASGNLLTLSREVETVEYPEQICEDDPFDGTYEVGGDTIVEFERDTGVVVREFSLFDVLNPLDNLWNTVPTEFCSPYLNPRYPDLAPVRDWTHANAVVLDEERNALIVSSRNTDEVLAIRYQDDDSGAAGEVLWSLGRGGNLELTGPGEWFVRAHAPEVQPDGSILLYDNGKLREGTSLEDPERYPYSRAVRYQIDEAAGTATQEWEHRFPAEEGVYAPYLGDADDTPSGTVLINHGGMTTPLAHSPGVPGLELWGRLIEVDEASGELLFDLRVRDPENEENWRIYRAERIDRLYPPPYEAEPLP